MSHKIEFPIEIHWFHCIHWHLYTRILLTYGCNVVKCLCPQRKMTLLEDNHPCAQYNYLFNVQTGHRRGAGTTAKVIHTVSTLAYISQLGKLLAFQWYSLVRLVGALLKSFLCQVMVTLQFTEGQSESYNLSDPEKPVFERGGMDVFLLSMPFSLGELQSIEISHDNSGRSPDW